MCCGTSCQEVTSFNCVTEVRRYVECVGGTNECNQMNKMVQLEEGTLVKVSDPWGSLHTTQ